MCDPCGSIRIATTPSSSGSTSPTIPRRSRRSSRRSSSVPRRRAAAARAAQALDRRAARPRALPPRRRRARARTPPLGGAPLREVAGAPVIIVGGGPAGLFCAYELARAGIAAVDRRSRQAGAGAPPRPQGAARSTARVDPDSNYCFGEGGAGTYCDGKLYTRSHKRGDVRDVIEILALHGAPARHPRRRAAAHRLEQAAEGDHRAARARSRRCGSERPVRRARDRARRARRPRDRRPARRRRRARSGARSCSRPATRRATSTSCSPRAGVRLEAKPFALGVRIEHPQPLIDRIQYGRAAGHPKLPAAAYRLAFTPDDGRGVFSFCMCPGGWIVPASTEPDGARGQRHEPVAARLAVRELGARRRRRARGPRAARAVAGRSAASSCSARLERAAAVAGGGELRAPATRATDFVRGAASSTVPAHELRARASPRATSATVLDAIGLPLAARLREALARVRSPDARLPHRGGRARRRRVAHVVAGARAARSETLESPDLAGLYPCGEGAGYAGGIVVGGARRHARRARDRRALTARTRHRAPASHRTRLHSRLTAPRRAPPPIALAAGLESPYHCLDADLPAQPPALRRARRAVHARRGHGHAEQRLLGRPRVARCPAERPHHLGGLPGAAEHPRAPRPLAAGGDARAPPPPQPQARPEARQDLGPRVRDGQGRRRRHGEHRGGPGARVPAEEIRSPSTPRSGTRG